MPAEQRLVERTLESLEQRALHEPLLCLLNQSVGDDQHQHQRCQAHDEVGAEYSKTEASAAAGADQRAEDDRQPQQSQQVQEKFETVAGQRNRPLDHLLLAEQEPSRQIQQEKQHEPEPARRTVTVVRRTERPVIEQERQQQQESEIKPTSRCRLEILHGQTQRYRAAVGGSGEDDVAGWFDDAQPRPGLGRGLRCGAGPGQRLCVHPDMGRYPSGVGQSRCKRVQ